MLKDFLLAAIALFDNDLELDKASLYAITAFCLIIVIKQLTERDCYLSCQCMRNGIRFKSVIEIQKFLEQEDTALKPDAKIKIDNFVATDTQFMEIT